MKAWPRGTIATHAWLRRQGVSRDLAKAYARSDWLRRVGPGAFTRGDSRADWTGGLHALQSQLALPVHAGGKTAFQLLGQAHFLPRRRGAAHLFGPPGVKLPSWFRKGRWDVHLRHHMAGFLPFGKGLGFTTKDMDGYSIDISSLERAVLELLYLVPDEETFEESRHLMEGLVTLRPSLLQRLLENCSSIKVKRLFLALAEPFDHPWFKELKPARLDLGKGKRVLFKGGWLHPKYLITLPEKPTA